MSISPQERHPFGSVANQNFDALHKKLSTESVRNRPYTGWDQAPQPGAFPGPSNLCRPLDRAGLWRNNHCNSLTGHFSAGAANLVDPSSLTGLTYATPASPPSYRSILIREERGS